MKKKKSKFINEPLKTNGNSNSIHRSVRHKKVMSSKMNTNNNYIKNGKSLKKPDKNMEDFHDYFSNNKIKNNQNLLQSCRTTSKYVKIVKNEGKSQKKKMNHIPKIKQFEIEDESPDEMIENINPGRRRGLSCAKRHNKIKI